VTGRGTARLLSAVALLLLVQSTIGIDLRIGGAHPELMWLVPVTAGLVGGARTGAIAGFVAGMAADLVLPTPFGLSALVGCMLGAGVGRVTAPMDTAQWWVPTAMAALGSAAAVMMYAVLGAVLGQEQMLRVDLGTVVAVVAVVNALAVRPVRRLVAWSVGSPAVPRRSLRAEGVARR
jgi:rod shape-determining protein MreD